MGCQWRGICRSSSRRNGRERGAELVDSSRELASVVMLSLLWSLPMSRSLMVCLAKIACLLHGALANFIHVDMSTVSPTTSKSMAGSYNALGMSVRYLASPVVGRPEAAASKKLATFTSGPLEAFEPEKPILAAFTRVAPCGRGEWVRNCCG
eukprot:EC795824.1.p2 GENE.EC795824.1~~EC795824.1.p2  ORF type:complete len:152 (+),score=3.32 EC795824.1:45-500(+)